MNLVPSTQQSGILQALDNLWDTMQIQITVVKEPEEVPTSLGGGYIPGFGLTSNPSNVTYDSEQRTFNVLKVTKLPDSKMEELIQKEVPHVTLYINIQQEGRDYILDGRKNKHILVQNQAYRVFSEDGVTFMLSRPYYKFRLELIK